MDADTRDRLIGWLGIDDNWDRFIQFSDLSPNGAPQS
jgi:hypothetical protein